MSMQSKKQIGFLHTKISTLWSIGILIVIVSLFLIVGLSEQTEGGHAITVPTGGIVSGPGGGLGNVSGYGWSSNIGWIKFRDHADLEELTSPILKPFPPLASQDIQEERYWDEVTSSNKNFLFLTDGRYFYKYDNDDPTAPFLLASFDYGPTAEVKGFIVKNFFGVPVSVRAFVALKGEDAISVLDINDGIPGSITEAARNADIVNFLDIEQLVHDGGTYAYIPLGDAGTGFTVVELTETGAINPSKVSTPTGVSRGIAYSCYLFFAGDGYFSVSDTCANALDPPEIGSIFDSSLGRTYGMALNNNYAFITMYEEDRICAIDFGYMFDFPPPSNTPQLLTCKDDSVDLAAVGGIQIRDGFLYVTPVSWSTEAYVTVVDFGNFDNVTIVDKFIFSGEIGMSAPFLFQDHIYVASETGLHVLTIPYQYSTTVIRAIPGDSAEGDFLGSAWSPAVGWVSFNKPAQTGIPPDGSFKRLDLTETGTWCGGSQYDVCGWVRALYACYHDLWDGTKCTSSGAGDWTGGWDGWIKLRGDGGGVLHTMDQGLSTTTASFLGESGDFSGRSVTGVGDVDGDGYDDFLIGAYGNNANAGKTYLILGKSGGWALDIDLSTDAAASFLGENIGDFSGFAVSGVGNVNGDAYNDFLIGAYNNDEGGSNAGKTYLILGRDTASWALNVDIQTAAAASFIGENIDDFSGRSISGAGNVDNDAYDDFIIGAWGNNSDAGKTYLILGRDTASWALNVDIQTAAAASFLGENIGDFSGGAVSGVGNVNKDDFDDFLIGAQENDDGGSEAGKTYLILGRDTASWAPDVDLGSGADASFTGEDSFDFSGSAVSGAGDVDGDGYDDFLIGAYFDEEATGNPFGAPGQTYLILGRDTASWALDVSLSTTVADASFWGEADGDNSGRSVSGAGDVNSDGYDDFLIGAYRNDEGGSNAGQTYLILGRSSGWIRDMNLATTSDASFLGENIDDLSGRAVSGVGDVDNNGFDDFLIGAHGNDEGGAAAGQTYLMLPDEIVYGAAWDPPTKELEGWAWGGDVVGWVSFNCNNDHDEFTPGVQTACAASDYKVIVYIPPAVVDLPPTASGLTVTPGDYCVVGSHSFSWTFSDPEGGIQKGYELEVTTDPTFAAVPEVQIIEPTSSATTRSVSLGIPPGADQLAYNTKYYWRVKVFDDPLELDSGWVKYTNAAAAPPNTFKTEKHLYPDANFTFSPSAPSQGEEISFTEAAVCYNTSNSPTTCPVAASSYVWDFGCVPATCSNTTAIGQNAITTYFDTASHTVSFTITDNQSFSCTGTDVVNPLSPLPLFREVAPSGG